MARHVTRRAIGCAAGITVSLWMTLARAETVSSSAVPVSATVDAAVTMQATMLRKTSATDPGTQTATMDYGILQRPVLADGTLGALVADAFYDVFIGINTSGRPYTLAQTASPLTSASGATIPPSAWKVTPVQATPAAGVLGPPGAAASANKLLYTSDAQGRAVTVEAVYAIVDTASEVVAPDQPAGNYTSNVSFTVTTN